MKGDSLHSLPVDAATGMRLLHDEKLSRGIVMHRGDSLRYTLSTTLPAWKDQQGVITEHTYEHTEKRPVTIDRVKVLYAEEFAGVTNAFVWVMGGDVR